MARRKAIVYELRALSETFPDPPMVSDIDMCGTSSALPVDHMQNATRMLRTFEMKQIRGEVQAHRTDTRAEKSAVIISRESLCKFLRSHGKIPRLIELFAREQTFGSLLLLQGMLSGYTSVLSGHRRCVLINMTADEVSRAGTSPDGFRVISGKHHKTAAFFGRAKIALSP
ncbi:hypothetical protein IRJ41_020249 [Triplophysa rosa]|uniref:Uncharacterized protein n=1 Tax=Triplophysa rosa TaxID=992332 RepID=A0A9W7W7V0_TRIRA|nr:hypothetical protein IRJ41_020249 [Triplophysa rosa]